MKYRKLPLRFTTPPIFSRVDFCTLSSYCTLRFVGAAGARVSALVAIGPM
jgi:hypothetical protein